MATRVKKAKVAYFDPMRDFFDSPEETELYLDQARKVVNEVDISWATVFASCERELACCMKNVAKMKGRSEVFPIREEWFSCFKYTKLDDVRVVIVGQDPYPQRDRTSRKEPYASGLAFSLHEGQLATPPSIMHILQVVYEGKKSASEIRSMSGDLRGWCKQGVLLLNTGLTVIEGSANSMDGCWDMFTGSILKKVYDQNERIVVMNWGKVAEAFVSGLGMTSALKLTHCHPTLDEFLKCDHFTYVNSKLVADGQAAIDWTKHAFE